MLDALDIWLSEYEKLPQDLTGDDSPKNIANFIDERVTGKLDLDNTVAQFSPPPSFTWQKDTFESLFRLITKIPSPDVITPAIKIATAWQTATQTGTMMITVGAVINPVPPPTNGIVGTATAILDPASLSLAYSDLVSELSSATSVAVRADAVFPKAMYAAFKKLTFTITGIDTTPPPVGPWPINLPMTPII